MREWDDQAIILRAGKFRERDVWLKALCKQNGILTLFAFGGAISKKRFCGCLDIYNTLNCHIKNSRDDHYFNLQEATLMSTPLQLRHNWRKMGLAANCLRFVEACNVNSESSCECFEILEDLRLSLESPTPVNTFVPALFRLRLAGALGFAPELHYCYHCGKQHNGSALFKADEGRILCVNCAQGLKMNRNNYDTQISHKALTFLRKIIISSPTQWSALELPVDDTRICARVIDSFIQYHLGLNWNNGAFRHI